MKRVIVTLIALMTALTAGAQAVMLNPNPGKVSDKEVALSVYPLDTTAAAVYLVDRTELAIRVDKSLRFDLSTIIYRRIKILKESGKDIVDYKLLFYDQDKISKIKVTTYNMVDGKVVKTKLSNKYIVKERVSDNIMSCSFSAPEVRVGSVVEVSWEELSDRYWDIPELMLQRAYPINFVTVSLNYPDYFSMNRMTRGYINPTYSESKPMQGALDSALPPYEIISHRYSLADVPAQPHEPSSLCPDQYRVSVLYELAGLSIQGIAHKRYSREWADVDEQVKESPIVSQCAVKGKFLDPFVSQEENEKQAIVDVRNAVVKAVKWDGNYKMVPGNVRDAIKDGTGSSATINAIVASVLNSMGYKASPMLLRGRHNGVLANSFVSTDAFSNMMLKIETPSRAVYYLDAAPDYGYLNVFNPMFLVDKARVYAADGLTFPYWEDLTPKAMATSMFMVDATLQEDGTVKGTLSMHAQGEASFLVRQTKAGMKSDEEYIELLENDKTFETISFEDQTDSYSGAAGFTLEFEQTPNAVGDYLYIRPIIESEYHKSDYPPGERHTPVDFYVKDYMIYNYTLHIPEGYEVVELPPVKSLKPVGFDALAVCRPTLNADGSVSLNFTFKNNSLQVPVKHYSGLRAFWEQLCNMIEGTIVLKKK